MKILLKNNTIFVICFLFFYTNYSRDNMFDNFEDNNKKNWEFISDNVMGGVSFGKVDFLKENQEFFIRMTGFVSLQNNGGFIQVRRKIHSKNNTIKRGIKLVLRGNEMSYYIHLRTKYTILPWQYYQGTINVNENWSETKVEIKNFTRSGVLLPKKINPKHIKSIAIVAFGKEHKARIDVKEIVFY